MTKVKWCIDCGKKQSVKRKRCEDCVKIFNRQRAKKYYKKDHPRYGIINCDICGEVLIKNRPNQTSHGKCSARIARKSIGYNKIPRNNTGKSTVGRHMLNNLNLIIPKGMHLHHIDENPLNNRYENWLLLSAANHGKLHAILRKQWSLSWKQDSSNAENCWNILRDQITTTWLETMNVIRLKISDIGQSAAEPLMKDICYTFYEERSETTYCTSKSQDMMKI